MLSLLFGRIKEESTEEWDPHAVTEYSQIGLCELKSCWVLIHHLPHAVQEQHEEWGLDQCRTDKENTEKDLVNMFILELNYLTSGTYLLFVILLQVVASVQKAMTGHHPLLLHQTLKSKEAAIMRIQHQLH